MTQKQSLQKTPLHSRQRALGARFVPFAGWEMPVQFTSVTEEHHATRNAAGLFDISHMGELWVTGPNALVQVDRLITNDLSAKQDGEALYTLCCAADGRILDDLIVYRFTAERILVVCNAGNRDKISTHFASEIGRQSDGSLFEDKSDTTTLLAVQGPQSEVIVGALFPDEPIDTLPRFGTHECLLKDGTQAVHSVIVARTGYSGEDGFELFINNSGSEYLWDQLQLLGTPHGLQPAGLGARDTLRLEGSLRLYGQDIDEQTNVFEAGLGWTVKLKTPEFVGQAALALQKAANQERKLVGIEMVGRGIARHGYTILDKDGAAIGVVTSGAPSLSLNKNIGMGYVPHAFSQVGTRLTIAIRRKVIEAVVCKMPFYRRNE